MQFGMPSLIEIKSLEDCVSLCKDLGLSFVELNMNLPQYQIQNIDVARFARTAESSGIYFTLHLDENFNACDFNQEVAKAYLNTALQSIELAKKLGIPIINMHLANGVYFTMPDKKIYLYNEYMDAYLDSLKRFRDACEKAIGGFNITICIENSEGYDFEFSRRGLKLLLSSGAFGLTFDLGHNFSTGGGDEEVIMQYEAKLRHMHVHDAAGSKNHLVPGTGEIDLHKYLKLGSQHGCRAVLETKTVEGLKQSAAYISAFVK